MKADMKIIPLWFFTSVINIQAVAQAATKKYQIVNFDKLAETSNDTVRLKAYVLDVYRCPPCPPGAICKPCMENYFTVVEQKPVDIMKIPLGNRIRIFTNKSNDLTVGKQYIFTITFRNKKTSPSDNLELISLK
jgi:hypothetical protein